MGAKLRGRYATRDGSRDDLHEGKQGSLSVCASVTPIDVVWPGRPDLDHRQPDIVETGNVGGTKDVSTNLTDDQRSRLRIGFIGTCLRRWA